MNELSGQIDDVLVELATGAISNPDHWGRVIHHMMITTGAPAAMITLRDAQTCQIVDDDAFVQEFHSPLICGFSAPLAEFYLQELRSSDPWADAQRGHFPTRPQVMSEICAPSDFPEEALFKWLGELGICDTVAVAIDQMQSHWTALNIFVPVNDENVRSKAVRMLEAHLPILKNSWKGSQELIHSRQLSQAILEQLAALEYASCIVSSDGKVLTRNTAFDEVLSDDAVAILSPGRTLSLPGGTEFHGLNEQTVARISSNRASDLHFIVNATPFDVDPMFKGRKEVNWLLTIRSEANGISRSILSTLDYSQLDEREAQLTRLIIDGQKVKDAGAVVGLGRSQTFKLWADVKHKLGVKSAHQLR